MFLLIKKLFKIGLLTPIGFSRLTFSLLGEGTNLMALLRFAARKYKIRLPWLMKGKPSLTKIYIGNQIISRRI